MNLPGLITSMVGLGNRLTASMQTVVTHHTTTGKTAYGPTHTDVPRLAIVEDGGKPMRLGDGTEAKVTAKLTFLESVVVTSDDLFTVRGKKAPVLRFNALLDDIGEPYLMEVWLGAEGAGLRS